MGDDDKIKSRKEIIKGSESRFLPDEIRDLEGQTEVYSLEQEFAKTKKNKNIKLQLFVVLFVALIVGLATLYTIYLEREGKDIKVDIKEFDDLRLKEFLDSAKNRGSDIDIMKINLQVLRVEMLNAVLDVKERYYAKEMNVIAGDSSPEEIEGKLDELRTQEDRAVKAVRRQYIARIAKQKREIAKMERNKREAEKRIKEEEKYESSEDRLHRIKMNRLKKTQETGVAKMRSYYDNYVDFITLKYNPKFVSDKLNTVVNTFSSDEKKSSLTGHDSLLEVKSGAVDYSELHDNISNLMMIVDRLMWIPYVNSIKPAIEAMGNLTAVVINDFTRAVDQQDTLINHYSSSFNHILEVTKKDNRWGFIIDAKNPKNVYCHMNDTSLAKDGVIASVYRPNLRSSVFSSKETFVGRIRLFKKSGRVMASVVKMEKGEKLQPVDLFKIEK